MKVPQNHKFPRHRRRRRLRLLPRRLHLHQSQNFQSDPTLYQDVDPRHLG